MSASSTQPFDPYELQSRECVLRDKTSPEACLLLNIGMSLTKEDVCNIKLLLTVDRHVKRREFELLQTGSELVTYLFMRAYISKINFDFLKMLMDKIKRRDLCAKIEDHEKNTRIQKETVPPGHMRSELVINSSPEITSNTPCLYSCGSVLVDIHEENKPAENCEKGNQDTNMIDDDVLMSSQNSIMSVDSVSSDEESAKRSLLCEADSTSAL